MGWGELRWGPRKETGGQGLSPQEWAPRAGTEAPGSSCSVPWFSGSRQGPNSTRLDAACLCPGCVSERGLGAPDAAAVCRGRAEPALPRTSSQRLAVGSHAGVGASVNRGFSRPGAAAGDGREERVRWTCECSAVSGHPARHLGPPQGQRAWLLPSGSVDG